MPDNLEYVLFSYGVWVLAFAVYIPLMRYRIKTYTDVLNSHSSTVSHSQKLQHSPEEAPS